MDLSGGNGLDGCVEMWAHVQTQCGSVGTEQHAYKYTYRDTEKTRFSKVA